SYVPQTVRRALSAWIIYCNDNRSRVKEANPSFGIKEMSQALSEEFRALTEEEKKVYEDKAALDKERYVREIQEQKRLMALHGSRVAPSMDIQKEYSLSKELIIPL
ncbi:nhp6, partial [Symbiodinium microadriaticum]